MGLFTDIIKDEHGDAKEVLSSQGKLILISLIGTGVLGTNVVQYVGVEKQITNVMEQGDVELMLDQKILQIESDQIEQMKVNLIADINIEHRITQSEILIKQYDERIEFVEDSLMFQKQLIVEVLEEVKK